MKMKNTFIVCLLSCAVVHALPFAESFDALTDGSLDGQNGWAVESGAATVQSVEAHIGKAVELNGAVSHAASSTNGQVWVTQWAKFDAWPEANPEVTNPDTSVAFYVGINGMLTVYSNTVPVELSVQLEPNVWHRFDVYCDYEELTWNLSVNQTNVMAGFPLYSDNPYALSVRLENEGSAPVYVDEINVADTEPVGDLVDTDADSIPDWWEQKYFGGVTGAAPSEENLHAYIAGLSPSEKFEIVSDFPLQWNGQPGRRYSVWFSTNLVSGFTFQTNLPWNTSTFTDLVNANEPVGFYKVEVALDE